MTRQIYCHICGGPFLGDDHSWLGEAILLSTGHRTQNGIEVDDFQPCRMLDQNGYRLAEHLSDQPNRVLLRLDSEYDHDHRTFLLSRWDEKVHPSVPVGPSSHFMGGTLFIPVHKVCLKLADHFISIASTFASASTNTNSDRITSELRLWEVLCRRLDQFRDAKAKEPHNFYASSDVHSGMPWEREPEPGESDEFVWSHYLLMADSVHVPNITESILENLKTVSDTESQPNETQDHSYHSPLGNKTFPWLWDLDTGYVRDKQLSGRWDWSSLACSLSRANIHMPGGDSLQIPLSLRNRRRIWRILEEARVNDLPVTRRQFPPRYDSPITSDTPLPRPVPPFSPPAHMAPIPRPNFPERLPPRTVERDGIFLRLHPKEPDLIGFGPFFHNRLPSTSLLLNSVSPFPRPVPLK